MIGGFVGESGFQHGEVNESRPRIERGGLPAVCSARTGSNNRRFVAVLVLRSGPLDRAPSLHIDARGPHYLSKGFRRNELPRNAVQNVEETILRRMQQYPANLAINGKIRENDLFRRIVIPFVGRVFLIMPNVFTRVRPQRDERRSKETIACFAAANLAGPWICVSRS